MIKCVYCEKNEADYIENGQSTCADCKRHRDTFVQRLEQEARRRLLANPPRMPVAPKQRKR